MPVVDPDCDWHGMAAVSASYRVRLVLYLMAGRWSDQLACLTTQGEVTIAEQKTVGRRDPHKCCVSVLALAMLVEAEAGR